MAHKKGQGSVKNGRDSQPKRRGVKKYAGEFASQSSILVTQCGTKYHPGRFVYCASNYSIHAEVDGYVYFDQKGKRVNIRPADPTDGPQATGYDGSSAALKPRVKPSSKQSTKSDSPWSKPRHDSGAHPAPGGERTTPKTEMSSSRSTMPRTGVEVPPRQDGKRPDLEPKPGTRIPSKDLVKGREMYYYDEKLLAWRSEKVNTTTPHSMRTPNDLELEKRPGSASPTSGFGATVAPDGHHLLLPPTVYDFLETQFITTATGFVAYVRAFPDVVAEGLHLNEEEVTGSALPELIEEVSKVLDRTALAPVSSDRFGYGTLD